jgi:hypothetical protein
MSWPTMPRDSHVGGRRIPTNQQSTTECLTRISGALCRETFR